MNESDVREDKALEAMLVKKSPTKDNRPLLFWCLLKIQSEGSEVFDAMGFKKERLKSRTSFVPTPRNHTRM
jgi:hypothetical protein